MEDEIVSQRDINMIVMGRVINETFTWEQFFTDEFIASFNGEMGTSFTTIADIMTYVESSGFDDEIADALEAVIEELGSDDVWGTEGQNDPRGDFRNGQWSMWEIEA